MLRFQRILFNEDLKIPIVIVLVTIEILILLYNYFKIIKKEKDEENTIKYLKKMISNLHIFELIISIYYFYNSVLNWNTPTTIVLVVIVILKMVCYSCFIKNKNVISIKNKKKIYAYIFISIVVFNILLSFTGGEYYIR